MLDRVMTSQLVITAMHHQVVIHGVLPSMIASQLACASWQLPNQLAHVTSADFTVPYSLLLTYTGRVMTLSCRRRYMRYSHLLGDFRHDFGPQLDLGLRPRCSASAQYHAFRLVQQKAISNTKSCDWHGR